MSVGSNVFGVVCACTSIVPPRLAPGSSSAGPLAFGSIAFACVVIFLPVSVLPEPWLFSDGLLQPASTRAAAAVAATTTLNRLAISPLLIASRDRRSPSGAGVESVEDRVTEQAQRQHEDGDRKDRNPQELWEVPVA